MRSTLRRLRLDNPIRQMAVSDRNVLALCIGAAFIFWLILNLSQEYDITKEVAVSYTVDPERVVVGEPPRSLPVQITGRGWNLIWENLRGNIIPVEIDLEGEVPYSLTSSRLQSEITRNLSSTGLGIKNLTYEAQTILTSPREGKKVPIRSDLNLVFAGGYQASETIAFTPDSVLVSGSIDALAEIDSWPTASTTIEDIEEDISTTVELATPSSGIALSRTTVEVEIPVGVYIERRITVPVEVFPAPESGTSRVFPSEVELRVTLPQDNYRRYDATDFRVIADLRQMQTSDNQNTVPLVLTDSPHGVNTVTFEPRAAEYYIYRQN